MKKFFLIFSCFFFFLCGFSLFRKTEEIWRLPSDFIQKPISFSTDKPEEIQQQLSSITQKYSSQAVEWWVMYKKALLFKTKDVALFCNNMLFLSQIQSFPLKHHASLNLYSYCNKDIEMHLSNFPEWLKKKAATEWYKKAKKAKKETEIMEAAYQMYKLSKDKHLREVYLLTAIKLADKMKNNQIKEWRKKLYTVSPRYIRKPSHSQKLNVANDFRHARQFKKAAFYYRQLLNSPQSSFHQKNQSFKWIRWIYKMQKNNKKYLVATLQWKNWLKRKMKKDNRAIGPYHNIFYLLARTQWTLNQTSKALTTLDQIEKELKGKISMLQVYRMKALIFDEQGNTEKALLFFQKALKEKYSDSETWEQTKWNYAWTLKKAGKREDSIDVLSELLDTSESEYLPSRVLFWIGRLYEDLDNQDKAYIIYEELIEKDPLSYYGLLAHYKLGWKISIEKKKNFYKTQEEADYAVPQWLLSLADYDAALDFLKYKADQYQKDKNKKTETWSTLFYYMAKSRSYFPLFRMVGKLPLEERTVFFKSYADLMFPTTHIKEVEKAAALFNVEKEMICALIRQESAWDPKARSPADAFGLMQVRPFVARQTAKENGISYKNIYDLYDPKKNILLGTAFFKKLFNKYNSQFILTTAVYNAGRTAVLGWTQKLSMVDALSFIEEIPYEETRTYVRLLIRNFVFYKLLTSPKREITFPEWLLHIEPLPK